MFGKGLLVGFGFGFEILLSGCGREARRLCRLEPRRLCHVWQANHQKHPFQLKKEIRRGEISKKGTGFFWWGACGLARTGGAAQGYTFVLKWVRAIS